MKKYLVTGGAGFIGSHVANKLIEQENKVYIIDNLSTGYKENVPKAATFLEGNVYDDCIEQFSDISFDAILHIAGQSSGEISFENPVYDIRTNTESTIRLLKFALKNNCKRFIYASTMSVYGKVNDNAIDESHPTIPLSFYGVGKIASENYMRIYSNYGIDFTSLRLFNVYGPGQNLENMRQGMVSIFLKYLLDNKEIHVKGPSKRFRDFVYIDDVSNAFIECLNNSKTNNKTYNVAKGVKTTIGELVKELILASGQNPDHYPHKFEGGTPGDQHGIFADISSLTKDTNWSPEIELSEGLKRMWDWAKSREHH